MSPTPNKELEKISRQEALLKCKLLGQMALNLMGILKTCHVIHQISVFLVLMVAEIRMKALMKLPDNAVLEDIWGRSGYYVVFTITE